MVDGEYDVETLRGEPGGQSGAGVEGAGDALRLGDEDGRVRARDAGLGDDVCDVGLGSDRCAGSADADAGDVVLGAPESVEQLEDDDHVAGAGGTDHLD